MFATRRARYTLALALVCLPPRLAAQVPAVHVGAFVQEQFTAVTGDTGAVFANPGASSSFEITRARLFADGTIGRRATFQLVTDFAEGTMRVEAAWVRVVLTQDATSGLALTAGQERKPFNRYEQTPTSQIVVGERGARLRGLAHAASQDNLLQQNGYIQFDDGASLDAWLLGGRVALKAGLWNGAGESAPDVNGAKTVGARMTLTAASDDRGRPRLRLGAAAMSRDRGIVTDTTCTADCAFFPDSSRRSTAWGADLEWGDFRPGLHVIADVSTGQNVAPGPWTIDAGRNYGNLRPGTPDSAFTTFRAMQVVASWRFERGARNKGLVQIVEPAVRIDLTDPDITRAGDAGMLLTGALNVHFTPTAILRAAYDAYRYREAGAAHWVRGIRLSWQVVV